MGLWGSIILGHPSFLPGMWSDRLAASFVILAYDLAWQSVRSLDKRSSAAPYIILVAAC
jgi:hypothetical protein